MLSDDQISTAADENHLRRKLRRSIENEDEDSFTETYLKLVDISPELYDMLQSICDFLEPFTISAGGKV